jgi:hypothetical protein
MEIVTPTPFYDALAKLGSQSVVGSTFSSSEWSDLPLELRESAFFSSRVESVQFLQRAQDAIADFLAANRTATDDGQTVLATGSRAAFVSQMQDFLVTEGVLRTKGGLTDIAAEKRLGLIFDVKTRQANDFGFWKQGMNPDVLNEFPAMRFIRVRDVKEPRELHERFQDQVYLKTDPIWWLEINHDFGVPWGPWGWGCGHDVEDVDRDEAEELGLLKAGQRLDLGPVRRFLDLNRNLQASTKNLAPELVDKLLKEFGDRVTYDAAKQTIAWNPHTLKQELAISLPPLRQNPVSDAIELKVHGNLADQVNLALAAISKVHDATALARIPLYDTTQSFLGCLQAKATPQGLAADFLRIRSTGSWPALTAVHESGHLLDLMAIGSRGDFATVRLDAGMADVLAAAEKTKAVQELRQHLATTTSLFVALHLQYLLTPWEIWARAYAQFITERSGFPVLDHQLQMTLKRAGVDKLAQWSQGDFAPLSKAIETMFRNLNWL